MQFETKINWFNFEFKNRDRMCSKITCIMHFPAKAYHSTIFCFVIIITMIIMSSFI